MGTKRVRLINLPPELPTHFIQQTLSKCGEVRQIASETWNQTYRLTVDSGVRFATVTLTTHIPSHIYINGYRALVSCDTQPLTCYTRNETGHMYTDCPKKKSDTATYNGNNTATWAGIVAGDPIHMDTEPHNQPEEEMLLSTTRFPPLPTPVSILAMEHATESESPTVLSPDPLSIEKETIHHNDTRPRELLSSIAVIQTETQPIQRINKEAEPPTPPQSQKTFTE